MNELLFFSHIGIVLVALWASLRLGKEALIALVALQAVFANLLVIKQIHLFGLHVTAADVFIIGSLFGMNLLQEYFGAASAQKAMHVSFLSLLFFLGVAKIHLLYEPTPFDTAQKAFEVIFSSTFRLVLASIGVFFLVQRIDLCLFGFLKKRFSNRFLAGRMGGTLLISQAIDTVLFSFLGLYGLVESIFDIILMSFLIKCIVIGSKTLVLRIGSRVSL